MSAGPDSGIKQDPYALLDQIRKLVEELRTKIAEHENHIANLEKAIENHHISIFKEVKA